MGFRRKTVAVAAAWLTILGLSACDPPPRAQITVDSTAVGADGNPGDGVCSAPTADGGCTLQAAVEEAAALGPADIHVPAGAYDGQGTTLTVAGSVAISGDGVQATRLEDFRFVVADTGSLRLIDVSDTLADAVAVAFAVEGRLVLSRTSVTGAVEAISVAEGGSVGLWSSVVTSFMPLVNEGEAVAYGSTMRLIHGRWGAVFGAGDAEWAATATLAWAASPGFGVSCDPTGLTSHGYNRSSWNCGLTAVGDSDGLVESEFQGPDGTYPVPVATSPLVDAIPVGQAGCALDTLDLLGNPRGVDGNGDGIPGCDIGAVELQP